MIYQWSDSAARAIEKCCEHFNAGKVFSTSCRYEQRGMLRMMKHLTGKVDTAMIWELSYRTKGQYAEPWDLLVSCITEVFGSDCGTGADGDVVAGVKNALFTLYAYVEKPKHISTVVAEEYKEAIKDKNLAKLLFLLDVSADEQWDREQLFCELLNEKLFRLITFMGLYDQAPKLKAYRLYPFFYNLDTDKFPELADAVYSCLDPEKVRRYIFSKGLLITKMKFLIRHGMNEDTLIYETQKVRITFGGYMKFIEEILAGSDVKNCSNGMTSSMLSCLQKTRDIYRQTQNLPVEPESEC